MLSMLVLILAYCGIARVVSRLPATRMTGTMMTIKRAIWLSRLKAILTAPIMVMEVVYILRSDISIKRDTCFTSFTLRVIRVEVENFCLVCADQLSIFS